MATIKLEARELEAHVGENLLSSIINSGIFLSAPCGGRGTCGKCRIIVNKGGEFLSNFSNLERAAFNEEEIKEGYRLSCLAKIEREGTIEVEIPIESKYEPQKLLVIGVEPSVKLNAPIRKYFVKLPPPTLKDFRADSDRLLDTLAEKGLYDLTISYEALKVLGNVLRDSNWEVTVVVRDEKEIIWVEAGNTEDRNFGFALDVGTTKLAGYLVDLNSGKILNHSSLVNPQGAFGGDVISRIAYSMKEPKNLEKLNKAVIRGVNEILSDLCKKENIDANEIYEVSVAGNTTMHHIFLNLPPKNVAYAPYTPILRGSYSIKAEKLELSVNRGAYIFILPNLAGHVGADVVADILASQIYKAEDLSLLIDIGTNTEIILGNKDRLAAASAPSGPAFEGGHIKFGMKGEIGAIEKVWINPDNLEPEYKVIGDVKPRGICGSGIVDAVAHMYKANIVNESGKWVTTLNNNRIRKNDNIYEYVLAWKDETSIGKDIAVTQPDVRAIQLVKATIATGIEVLLTYLKVRSKDIKKVFLAGAFGNYVDPQSARTIGMYPNIPLRNVRFIGNAAGVGARLALISKDIREEAEKLSRKIEFIPLSSFQGFQEIFLSQVNFPKKS
ncbi:MAG: ASKHA domain-containing protein [Nitrososphaerales archaeon]